MHLAEFMSLYKVYMLYHVSPVLYSYGKYCCCCVLCLRQHEDKTKEADAGGEDVKHPAPDFRPYQLDIEAEANSGENGIVVATAN